MKYRKIADTEIEVSEVSLGCWTMGGLNWVDGTANGWANVDEDEVVAAIRSGLDQGVNHFDNADVYGNGRAERMLARVLQKLGVDTNSIVIASKVGHFKGTAEHAYEPAHIRHQCEQSLINLKRDAIDVYYLHHGDFGPEDRYLHAAAETLQQLKTEGKIRVIGQSAYSAEHFAKSIPVVKPSVLQSWAHAVDTQFINPDGPVGKLMAENKLSFVAFSPLCQGILLDKFDPENPPTFEPGDYRASNANFTTGFLRKMKPRLEALKNRFGADTEILASVALRYLLEYPNVACVIPGFRNQRQVDCNLTAIARSLSPEDVAFIQSLFEEV